MLSVKNLNQYYGGSHILRNISLDIPMGGISTLMGRNGAGKTTLLKVLMGVIPAKSGDILWQGESILHMSSDQRVKAGIAYVPQGREIFSRLSVEENLRMGMASLPSKMANSIPDWVYETFPVLYDMKHRRGGDLSGGQQQQLAIARALLAKPKLLILDEPTEGIQPSIIKDIGRVLKKLRDQGDMSILLVEQYYDFAEDLADYYALMSRGEIIEHGLGNQMAEREVKQKLAV